MTTEKHQCSEKVYPNERWGSFHPHNCHRPTIIERDGKWYCAIHDPEYIKAKREKSHAKYETGMAKIRRDIKAQELTKDLTLAEVESLKPERVRASNDLYEALKGILQVAHPSSDNSTMEFEKSYNGMFLVHGNRLEKAVEVLSKADGGK